MYKSQQYAAAHECGHAFIAALQGRGGRIIVNKRGGGGMCNTLHLMADWSAEEETAYALGGAAGEVIFDHARCTDWMHRLDAFTVGGDAAVRAARFHLGYIYGAFNDLTDEDPTGDRATDEATFEAAVEQHAHAFADVMARMLPHTNTFMALVKAVRKDPLRAEGVWFHPNIATGDIELFGSNWGVKGYAAALKADQAIAA